MNDQDRIELAKYRIKRANDTIQEINIHIDNKLCSTAVNRLYYACYYAVSALLVKNNISAQTHGGTRHMYGLNFIKNGLIPKESGKFYTDIFDKRQTGDYDDFVEIGKEDVICLLEPAKRLLLEVVNLLKE